MLKSCFLIVSFCMACCTMCFAQKQLSEWIWNGTTESAHYVSIADSAQVAFDASKLPAQLGMEDNSELRLLHAETDPLGFTHYRYRQTYLGVPVEHTMYIVHVKAGKIAGLSGNLLKGFGVDLQRRSAALLSGEAARTTALEAVKATAYQTDPDPIHSTTLSPELVWYCESRLHNPRQLQLAYKVDVYAIEPLSREWIFVNAMTGAILGREDRLHSIDATGTAATAYSGSVTIHSDLDNGIYKLHDLTRGQGIFTLSQGGDDYTSNSANWTLTGFNQYALDVHYGMAATYDYYFTKFGRNSLDNAGLPLYGYLKSSVVDNALWNGTSMIYGKTSANSSGVATIDICGHELTHGITQYTCALQYFNESGAINESLSDILGKSVQFFQKPSDINWVIGNDMDWLIRDLSDPNQYGQPDTYLGTYWWTSSSDNYGVHFNSGIGNFMFYLLVNGGSGTNDNGDTYHVDAIGQAKAEQIIYRSQTVYLFNLAQYSDWRIACINAATDLYGAASDVVTQVKNAWYAVGIGAPGNAQPSNTCNKPPSLSSSAITSSSATVSWGSVFGSIGYNIQYKPYVGTQWTTVTGLPLLTSKTLNGLAWGTIYNYRVQTKCLGGFSQYSTDKVFTTSSQGEVYCKSNGNNNAIYEYIDYVNIGNISRAYAYPDAGGYYNATSLSTTVNKGAAYQLTLSAGFNGFMEADAYPENWAVFVDWNIDGDFADAGETALTTNTTDAGNKTVTLAIPYTAATGSTRMRVSMNYDATPTACGAFNYGEVEDYTLQLQEPLCSETFEPNNAKGNAKSIATNADVLSQISSAADEDWFAFSNSAAASNIKVKLSTLPANYNLKFYDVNDNFVTESKKGGTTNESVIFNTSVVGTYKVKVYGKNGAFSNSQCYTINAKISASPFKLEEEEPIASTEPLVTLYPNPAATQLNVSIKGSGGESILIVMTNTLGQVMLQQEAGDTEATIQLALDNFPEGIYFVQLLGKKWRAVERLEILR